MKLFFEISFAAILFAVLATRASSSQVAEVLTVLEGFQEESYQFKYVPDAVRVTLNEKLSLLKQKDLEDLVTQIITGKRLIDVAYTAAPYCYILLEFFDFRMLLHNIEYSTPAQMLSILVFYMHDKTGKLLPEVSEIFKDLQVIQNQIGIAETWALPLELMTSLALSYTSLSNEQDRTNIATFIMKALGIPKFGIRDEFLGEAYGYHLLVAIVKPDTRDIPYYEWQQAWTCDFPQLEAIRSEPYFPTTNFHLRFSKIQAIAAELNKIRSFFATEHKASDLGNILVKCLDLLQSPQVNFVKGNLLVEFFLVALDLGRFYADNEAKRKFRNESVKEIAEFIETALGDSELGKTLPAIIMHKLSRL